MWETAPRDRRVRGRDRGRDRVPARDPAAVRDPGVGDRQYAAGAAEPTGLSSGRSRSRPACGGGRSRSRRGTSRPASRRTRRSSSSSATATATRCSPTTARRSTSRWRRCWPGRKVAVAESETGGLMSARLTERPGLLGVLRRRGRRLLERGEGRARGGRRSADRARRRGLDGGRRGTGRRCRASGSTPSSGRDHGNRRARRWDRGEAGRDRVLLGCSSAAASGSPARRACPAAAPTSATARRRSRCSCCGGCWWGRGPGSCPARRRRRDGSVSRRARAAVRRARAARRGPRGCWSSGGNASLGDVRRMSGRRPRQELHVTLCFLGWREQREVQEIAGACGVLQRPRRAGARARRRGAAPATAAAGAGDRARGSRGAAGLGAGGAGVRARGGRVLRARAAPVLRPRDGRACGTPGADPARRAARTGSATRRAFAPRGWCCTSLTCAAAGPGTSRWRRSSCAGEVFGR